MLITITIASVAVAVVMSVVAWRVVRGERERSAARVEALAQDIHRPAASIELPIRPAVDQLPLREMAFRPESATAGDMFAVATQPSRTGSRWGLALAVGAFAVACVGALAIVWGSDAPGTRIAQASGAEPVGTPAHSVVEVPLELTALSHDRDDGQLTVQGVVRNPANGTGMDRLSAVVTLFDRDGHMVTSTRAPLASPALIPGGESRFAVTIPDSANIARYRVSFRSDERVVSHIDKRVTP